MNNCLNIELHPKKSSIFPLSIGVDFVGFRNFQEHRLLRKRNIRKMRKRIEDYESGKIGFGEIFEVYQGWQAYSKWANAHNLRKEMKTRIIYGLLEKV